MAIDTAQKRFSMMNSVSPIPFLPMFVPDGAVDADDRFHLLNLYGGLEDDGGSPPVGDPGGSLMLMGVGA